MLTVVLDDDPTGTQSASDVEVLLDWDTASIAAALRAGGAVYLQTNSRAVPPEQAAQLAAVVRDQVASVSRSLGQRVLVVLRGDSTLRGHVFTESDVFAGDDGRILFVPAFPGGGRTTIGSVHRALINGVDTPVADTEFARDPVFGYHSSDLVEWTREQGHRRAIPVTLADLRASGGQAVADALAVAAPRELVVPDAATDADVELVHAGLISAIGAGQQVVVRCAAPLAAMCAGRLSRSFLPRPLHPERPGVLVVCGSHTAAATAQLDRLAAWAGIDPVVIPTDAAFADPAAAGRNAAGRARAQLAGGGIAVLATARDRRPSDDTLDHGAKVMSALIGAATAVKPLVGAVVSKGGITSAEVARTCFAARTAHVRGQVAAGISVWDLGEGAGRSIQVIVPGNVGDEDTLVDVMRALGIDGKERT
jgi:uncharacterized protein YgbK (DUF1537 family)